MLSLHSLNTRTQFHWSIDSQSVRLIIIIIIIIMIIIIIRNLYSAIMPLGGYRGAGGTAR